MNFLLKNNSLIFIVLWGSALSVTQTVLLREYLCIAEGNEISIGLMLSIWLLSNSIGAFIWIFKKRIFLGLIYIFPILGYLFSIFSILFLRYAKVIFDIPPGLDLDITTVFIVALFSISLPAIISGFSFPYLCAQSDISERSKRVAVVYGAESAGFVFGYLISIFASGIGINHFILISFSYGISLIFLIFFRGIIAHKPIKVLFVALAFLISSFILSLSDWVLIRDSFLRHNKGYEFISHIDTNYNRYVLAKRSEQYALFVNNRFSKLIGDDYNYKLLSHLIMSVPQKVEELLIVGEASLDMLRHIKEHNVNIDYVEYDSELSNFLKESIAVEKDLFSGIRIISDDGRRYIKNKRKKYDVVIMDISDPINLQLNRFYSVEFFGEVKSILNENGVLLVSLPSISSVPSDSKREFLVSVFNALKNQFRVVKPFEHNHTYILSSKTDFELELKHLVSRYRSFNITNCNFEPEIMSLAMQKENNERILSILEQSNGKINSDFNPKGMFLNLILWEKSVNEKGESLLSNFGGYLTIVVVVFLLLFSVFSLLFRKRRYLSSGVLMFYQGFFSMAIEFVIIYRFQIEFGTLYYFMAFLFSIFMCGLTVGSVLFIKIKISLLSLFALNLLLPLSLLLHSINIVFLYLLLLMDGLLTGIILGRLSSKTIYSEDSSIIKTASTIDYSDCIGAMLSAITVPLLFLPIIGVEYFLFFLTFISIIMLVYKYLTVMSE